MTAMIAAGASARLLQAGAPVLLGKLGNLEVRLACDEGEVEAALRLRYEVFYEERGLGLRPGTSWDGCDRDGYDEICDHLVVIDNALDPGANIVGTYRLLRSDRLPQGAGFYTATEFDLDPLLDRHRQLRFLELGRSCVRPAYRSKRTIELLWQGVWAYVRANGVDVMLGCASFCGVVPAAHAQSLSFLHQNARAQGVWAVSALAARHVSMDLMPEEAIDARKAIAGMPPLIKGYLRLGGMVGDGCVVDRDFGTTDVLIVLPVAAINPRYVEYYGVDGTRFSDPA